MFWGPFSRFGLTVAVAIAASDQALKLWLINDFELANYGNDGYVLIVGYLKLVMTWNPGISFGLFPLRGMAGQATWVALMTIAVALLWMWLARAEGRLLALSLGLIIGGAIGNAIDRIAYGAVADFVLFHIEALDFKWAVFNLADATIVAGVIGILYESLLGDRAAKAPRSPP